MGQFEVGQQELVDIHHYTYIMDMCMLNKADKLAEIVYSINKFLVQKIYFSMQGRNNYHKLMDLQDFARARKYMNPFQQTFLTAEWFQEYIGEFLLVSWARLRYVKAMLIIFITTTWQDWDFPK